MAQTINPPIHYKVKVKLVRFIKDGEIDFIDEEKEFYNSRPILAREEAFLYYQNYIDVLCDGAGEKYSSDEQARNVLSRFLMPGINRKELLKKIALQDSDSEAWRESVDLLLKYNHLGLSVNLVVDQPILDDVFETQVDDEILIHGIGGFDDPQSLMNGLNNEYDYYCEYDLDVKDYKRVISYIERDDNITEPDDNEILVTPFDWTGLDKLTEEELDCINETEIEGTQPLQGELEQENKRVDQILKIIEVGENQQVEFKPSLAYHFKHKIETVSVMAHIAKAICAFINTKGGFLFIGVNDDKNIQGLEYDFSLSGEKDSKDWFLLKFDHMVGRFFSHTIVNNLESGFVKIDAKTIFIVKVFPSKSGPFFLNGYQGEKEFYIRAQGGSPKIDGDAFERYCLERWPDKNKE